MRGRAAECWKSPSLLWERQHICLCLLTIVCVHLVRAERARASCASVEVEGSAVELLPCVYLSVSPKGWRGEGNNLYTHKVQTTAMPEEELQERDCWIPSPFSLLNPHWLDISPALVSECWELESGFPPPVSSFVSLLILLWGFSNYVHVLFFNLKYDRSSNGQNGTEGLYS